MYLRFSRNGYTLVELLIVMTILGILAVGLFQLTSNNRVKVQQIESAGQSLISLLREARALAVAGETVEVQGSPQVPQGGFGFFFDADARQGFVFADVDDDGAWDSSLSKDGPALSQSSPFESHIDVEAIKTDISGTPPTTTTVSISPATSNNPSGPAKDFWIIFSANSLEVTFGTENLDYPTSTATKAIEIKVGSSGLKTYSIDVNKVSRFLDIKLLST